jgi:hypothetical protein
MLLAADLVNGFAEILGNMKFIEGNLLFCLRQSFQCGINVAVNPEPGSAQGTNIVTTPCSSHFTLGTSATRIVLY